MQMARFIGLSALLASVLCLAGCGPSVGATYKVTGTVKFSDGTPLTKGTVLFTSDKHSATGPIQEDGTYSLTTLKPGDGAPPGDYKVTLGGDAAGTYPDNKPLVDPKFLGTTTSGLTASVKNQKLQYDITVEKPPQ